MTPRSPLPEKLKALGNWALVTGASDGIGEATADALAQRGFDVILIARRADRLQEVAEAIKSRHHVRVETVSVDLAPRSSISKLTREMAEREIVLDSVGVAVLAAGFGTSGAFVDADIDEELNMLDVNCAAVLTLAHIFGNAMATRGGGQLVLFDSLVGFQGNAMSANYSATKAHVQTFAEGLAMELRPRGVNVLCAAPGPVRSGFANRARMKMGMSDNPKAVAHGIVGAMPASGTIRPGTVSKFLGWNLAMTPRFLRIRIMSRIMSGMTSARGTSHG